MTKFCSYCGKQNSDQAQFCGYCGKPFSTTKLDTNLEYQKADLKLKKEQLELEKQNQQAQAKCPKCGSTSLVAHKKGYGIGKGITGLALTTLLTANPIGLVGLAAGNINAKKVYVTCLNCGKRFKL